MLLIRQDMRCATVVIWITRTSAISALLLNCLSALDTAHDVTQYGHTSWTRDRGQLPGGVFALTQTLDGRLWVGAEFGLFQFDGIRFSPFSSSSGEELRGQVITALAGGPDGALWIGTRTGLLRWDGSFLQKYEVRSSVPQAPISAIHVNRLGKVWIGSIGFDSGGLFHVEAGGLQPYTATDGFTGQGVQSIFEDRTGKVWVGTMNGLFCWRGGAFHRVGGRKPAIVGSIAEPADGSIIALLYGRGVTKVGESSFESYLIGASDRMQGRNLLTDRNGGLWIGTSGQGLIHVHDGRMERFTSRDGLSGDSALSLLEDREGNLWVGTERGLDRLRDLPVSSLTTREGLSEDTATSVCASRSGGVWIGTRGGLNYIGKGRSAVFGRQAGLPSNSIDSVFEDREQNVWVDTHQGLAMRSRAEFHRVDLPGSQQVQAISAVTEDRDGMLWFSDLEHGLISVRQGVINTVIPWSKFENRQAISLSADPQSGDILLGFRQGGVARYRPGHPARWYTAKDGLASGAVTDIAADTQGNAWIATEGGLSRLRGEKITTLNSQKGLLCDRIHALVQDLDGGMWLNTSCGLQHLTRVDLAAWEANATITISPQTYAEREGMYSRSVRIGNSGGGARSTDGRIWFPVYDGVAVVDPKNLHENRLPPPVAIELIRVNDQIQSPRPNLHFGPRAKDLEIDYTAFSLSDSERNRFRYKLEGYDAGWRDAGTRRQAFYTSLPPKKYRFRVVACNNDGLWNDAGAAVDFVVDPAFFQTLWFRALSVVASSATLLFLYKLRLKQVKAKIHRLYQERMGERTRIGRELHDTFLQNLAGLALHLDLWSKVVSDPPAAKDGLRKLRRESEQWLREARELIWDLRSEDEEGNLSDVLRQIGEKVTQNAGVRFHMQISGAEPALPSNVRTHCQRIVHEAIGNSVRHSEATEVLMEISYGGGHLVRIRMSDNGRGFDPERCPPGHWGLMTMRERAQKVGAEFKLQTSCGEGTQIQITVPKINVKASS